MGKVQHVTPKDGKWQVKGAGNRRATKIFDTQKEAIEYADKIAKNQDGATSVHGRKGIIRKK